MRQLAWVVLKLFSGHADKEIQPIAQNDHLEMVFVAGNIRVIGLSTDCSTQVLSADLGQV